MNLIDNPPVIADINLFRIGDIVSVNGVEDFCELTIERISDSGVTVSGPKCAPHTVISGTSPAFLVNRPDKSNVKLEAKSSDKPLKANSLFPFTEKEEKHERVERGTYTSKMNNIHIPEGKSFTVKQLAELNEIPIPYASKWVKDHCREVGHAEKEAGQRGRAAALFSVS